MNCRCEMCGVCYDSKLNNHCPNCGSYRSVYLDMRGGGKRLKRDFKKQDTYKGDKMDKTTEIIEKKKKK